MTKTRASNDTAKKGFHSKGFKEGIESLRDEIQLAFQWNRPSILVAVHNSRPGQTEAQQALEQEIVRLNKRVKYIRVDAKNPDIISNISSDLHAGEMVFFISGLDNSDEISARDIYQALNIRRENLVENNVRVVFWLTESEAADLPHHAPDFWAFRHRVVEFAPKRGKRDLAVPAGLFLWKNDLPWISPPALREQRKSIEELLSTLPNEGNAVSTRIETHLKLVQFNWLLDDDENFSSHLSKAFELSEKYPVPHLSPWVLTALGVHEHEKGNNTRARDLFIKALDLDPNNGLLVMNTCIASHSVGQNKDSVLTGRRSVEMEARNPVLRQTLSHIYLSMGKMEDAIKSAKEAQQLEPSNADFGYLIAISLFKNGQSQSSLDELQKTDDIAQTRNVFQQAYSSILRGSTTDALQRLKSSVANNEVTAKQILRDPNFNQLLTARELEIFK
jgi:Flp pilus assembly protein TadD